MSDLLMLNQKFEGENPTRSLLTSYHSLDSRFVRSKAHETTAKLWPNRSCYSSIILSSFSLILFILASVLSHDHELSTKPS